MSGTSRYPTPTRRLPRQPNLEQLRNQARELLRHYLANQPAAVAEVHRFERHPDPSSFALHDAQRVLARAYGYESWAKLKAFVDGVTVARFAEAAQTGDLPRVRRMLSARPELAAKDLAANDEHRALHFAVLRRDIPMVRLLMRAGADARKGIWPHREPTSPLTLALDRDYQDVAAAIEEEEARLRQVQLSCPNPTVLPAVDRISAAIQRGDTAAAIELLAADPALVHACDRKGATPLHHAAGAADVTLVAWLLARHAHPNKKDVASLTPLDYAALSADPRNTIATRFPEIAHLLLEHGAEWTMPAAVALADAPRIRAYIETDPDWLRRIDQDGGLLTLAVKHRRLDIVRLLLDLGADPDERIVLRELEEPTESWGMPLWYAALAGTADIAELLLDRGADPNANVYASGWPLRNAWHQPDQAVKRLLLARGAKPQPYMIAEMHDVEEAARMLAANPSEEVARELVWSAADHGCDAIVELALAHLSWPPADPRWHWVIIQPIRGAGPDSAQNEGHFRSMAALLRHGLDPNVQRFGATPLHFAAGHHGAVSDHDRARFASMLLDHGARLDLRDHLLESTPLGWACRWGRVKLAELLLARGAPADEPDAAPWAAPAAWARKKKHEAVLALLTRSRV
jgi:ankyrin repeat protein